LKPLHDNFSDARTIDDVRHARFEYSSNRQIEASAGVNDKDGTSSIASSRRWRNPVDSRDY
jgi:hypothetical protein